MPARPGAQDSATRSASPVPGSSCGWVFECDVRVEGLEKKVETAKLLGGTWGSRSPFLCALFSVRFKAV